MTTLATYRTLVLALLDDPTLTRYTNDSVDVALRMALQTFSQYKPVTRTYTITADGERIIVVSTDLVPNKIYKVVRIETDPDDNEDLPFYAYRHDEQVSIEIPGRIIDADETLDLYYYVDQTIDTLDGASGTTVTDDWDEVLAMGAAGYAAMIRANSRSESINMQPNVAKQLRDLANDYLSKFNDSLINIGSTFATLPAAPTDEY
jgi:hypothetical protein